MDSLAGPNRVLVNGCWFLTRSLKKKKKRKRLPHAFFLTLSTYFLLTFYSLLPFKSFYWDLGQQHMNGLMLWSEQVNRVGIVTTHTTYCVNLTFVNIGGTPDSSPTGFFRTTVKEWALQVDPVVHFFIAPFGSPMTLPTFQELDLHNKIILAPSASSPLLYQCSPSTAASQPECANKPSTAKRFERAFGLQPPATRASIPFLNLAQLYGAKTIGYYVESSAFSQSIVQGAQLAQATYGFKQVAYAFVQLTPQGTPTLESVNNASRILKEANPDIIVGGTTQDSCVKLTTALGNDNWVPKAALLSLCASDANAKTIAPNTKYFSDYVEWDRRLTGYQYVDNYYWPPVGDLTSPQQMWEAYTTRFQVPRTAPPTSTCIGSGVVVRHYQPIYILFHILNAYWLMGSLNNCRTVNMIIFLFFFVVVVIVEIDSDHL
jgi:hypothetical protein